MRRTLLSSGGPQEASSAFAEEVGELGYSNEIGLNPLLGTVGCSPESMEGPSCPL